MPDRVTVKLTTFGKTLSTEVAFPTGGNFTVTLSAMLQSNAIYPKFWCYQSQN